MTDESSSSLADESSSLMADEPSLMADESSLMADDVRCSRLEVKDVDLPTIL